MLGAVPVRLREGSPRFTHSTGLLGVFFQFIRQDSHGKNI